MPSFATLCVALSLAASVLATHNLPKRAAKSTKITRTTVITTNGPIPLTVNTEIDNTGVVTIIPGLLTITVSDIPAYLYLETATRGETTITSTYTTKVAITTSKKKSSTQATSTTPTSTLQTSSTTTLSAPTNTNTCCIKTNAQVVLNSYCDNQPDGYTCGSSHHCYEGGCYYFNTNDMCGSLQNSCNVDGGYDCVNGACLDVQNDVNNCGQAYEVCGNNEGDKYGCAGGVCINLNYDNSNCGAINNVCKTGTACKTGVCIDTTSDDNNCSVVGYSCPDGTSCVNSLCQ